MRNAILGLSAATVLAATGEVGALAAPASVWNSNVDEIVADILALHPDPFTKVGELSWRRDVTAFKDALPSLSDAERVVGLMRIVAELGDGHTSVELENYDHGKWYPIRIYEFSDGYFVTSAHQSHRELAGAKVISIAGRPVAEVVDDARALFSADNLFGAKERVYAVHNAFLMQGLGYADASGAISVEFELANGKTLETKLSAVPTKEGFYPEGVPIFDWTYRHEVYGLPIGDDEDSSKSEWMSAFGGVRSIEFQEYDASRPLYFQEMTRYTRRALPSKDAYYLQFNQTDYSGMVEFASVAFEEIDALRPKRLIIDIRNNFGGDGSTVGEFVRQFIRRDGDDRPWEELYLVTGRKTFSAAMFIIDDFAEHLDVTIVGEPAGAAMNSYGDAAWRPYPEIGLSLYVSTLRHQLSRSDDVSAFTRVDVPTEWSFEDYAAGRDPALDPILNGDEMRGLTTIALVDGGLAAKQAYADRRSVTDRLAWYDPPGEIEFRRVVEDLTRQGRLDDALATAELNAEINPYVWNSWYGLGLAQEAAGAPADERRFGSFLCVLLLDPQNWNKGEIESLFERERAEPNPAPGCPVQTHDSSP